MRIFDAHSHAFPDAIAAGAIAKLTAEATWMPVRACHAGTVVGLVGKMDEAGIARALLCSVATRPSQVEKITDWSAAVASERVVPFASIHPDFGTVEAEVERMAGLRIRGLKFHPQYMGCAVDDPRVIRIARAAARAGLAFVTHAGYDLAYTPTELGSPASIRRLHEAVPGLRLMACHLGGWRRWDEVERELVGLPIWLETSYTLGDCPGEQVARILGRHGEDWVCFGTDSPWAEPAEELGKFRGLGLGERALEKGLWENAVRFVGGE